MRRVRDVMPWQLWIVAVIAFWERAAFWGITGPWRRLNLLDQNAIY
jgi:POT family proton-dependent oligopeptide transporter